MCSEVTFFKAVIKIRKKLGNYSTTSFGQQFLINKKQLLKHSNTTSCFALNLCSVSHFIYMKRSQIFRLHKI